MAHNSEEQLRQTKLLFILCVQDLMDAQIIPADTDYRMFSYDYYGTLPGVDIAFLLDSSAYHTHEDAPHRVRPGTVQVTPYLSCLPICLKRLHLSYSKLQVPAENAKQSIAYRGSCPRAFAISPGEYHTVQWPYSTDHDAK